MLQPAPVRTRRRTGGLSRVGRAFHVATFYTEGSPNDQGLSLARQASLLRERLTPFCDAFHGYSARRIRESTLADGTSGASAVFAHPPVRGHPNRGLNTVGWGAFKPFVLLHVAERVAAGTDVLFVDCNLHKHWILGAFPALAARTAHWLLDTAGPQHEDVVMPRERVSLTFAHTCSVRSLEAAAARCGGRSLASYTSAQANRVAVRTGPRAAVLLRLWLDGCVNRTDELVPSAMLPGTHLSHTPEQCVFGLLDACRNGAQPVFFDPFFTTMHAKVVNVSAPHERGWSVTADNLPYFMSRNPPSRIDVGTARGAVLARLHAMRDTAPLAAAAEPSAAAEAHTPWSGARAVAAWRAEAVDVCTVFPRMERCATRALWYVRSGDNRSYVLRKEESRYAAGHAPRPRRRESAMTQNI